MKDKDLTDLYLEAGKMFLKAEYQHSLVCWNTATEEDEWAGVPISKDENIRDLDP